MQVVLSINSPVGHTIDTGHIGHVPGVVAVGAVGFDPSQQGGACCTQLQSILFKNSPVGHSINAGQEGHPPVNVGCDPSQQEGCSIHLQVN